MHNSGTSNDSFVLPSSSKYSTMVDYVKLKKQMAAVRRAASPLWLIRSYEDSIGGDSEHQTMMMYHHQQQQQQSRCEELCSLMGTMTLGMGSARQWNSRPARHTQSLPRPATGPPLSPIDLRDRERANLEEKWLRKPMAQVKCRQRRLDRTSRLQEKADALEKEKIRLESALSDLHDELHRLKERMTHVTLGSQT